MASASDHRAHAALQPADCLILLPQRLPAAVETSIGPAHYPAECTQSDAFLQPSLRARNGRANSNSFIGISNAETAQLRYQNRPESHRNRNLGNFTFRDEFAVDSLLQRGVMCEPGCTDAGRYPPICVP